MMNDNRIELIPLVGFPLVHTGADIPSLIISVLDEQSTELHSGDIVVVTHSIISIAEDKLYQLEDVEVSDRAREISEEIGSSPERVEVALKEARKILREKPVLITKTQHGIITDFSGVDESNVPPNMLAALPDDPDKTAQNISDVLSEKMGFKVPVIITDTQGRPWRKGAVNLAIGVAEMSPFIHNVGKKDLHGHELRGSLVCIEDQVAAATELVMGQAGEGIPVVIVRGIKFDYGDGSATQILRSDSENLFR